MKKGTNRNFSAKLSNTTTLNLKHETLNYNPFVFPKIPVIFALLLKRIEHGSNQIKAKRPQRQGKVSS
jgi:hypothetical protein